jgi:hypothetical protein
MAGKLKCIFHELVCRIKGHKFKVVSKDILWECERCKACAIRKGFLERTFETMERLPAKKRTQPSAEE